MLRKHWGEIEEEGSDITLDKYVPTSGKRPKLGEIRQRGDPLPQDKQNSVLTNQGNTFIDIGKWALILRYDNDSHMGQLTNTVHTPY
ncbi:uncharacterized protein LOC6564594 isoform X1 [Drosophila grimshawi]|uniref:uncharacterized protein LOC6564594 isoform X1 n=1 Tax=Drosophila grimshawi TaxID=7222 RepID=UPI000C8716D6|nr:uncharacterized protein LOC6564594 isoform X1 [Drosophila grimshawi]